MKKIYLSIVILCAGFFMSYAQSSEGGLPLSNQVQNFKSQQIDVKKYPTPDFASILEEEIQDEENGIAKPYMVSTGIVADINLNNSGTWTYLENGSKIWRLSISVPESKAIAFLYDQFKLPKGVRFFLTNKNEKQVLGAYTSSNNNEYSNFITEAVQGDFVNLEMNIEAHVDLTSIQFHINRISAYYRGVNDLTRFATQGAIPASPLDEQTNTSPCHLNAVCSIANVTPGEYNVPMGATVRVLIVSPSGRAGYCTGTLINNTGNAADGTCTPLLLTASHCDGDNNHDDADFSQWQFKFNYYYDSCDNSLLHSPSPTLNGASFKARSNYPSISTVNSSVTSLVADFLLLQITDPKIPLVQDLYFAGWNRNPDISNSSNIEHYNFFIGYHHPAGDVKKTSWSSSISANGTFNQTIVSGTHWKVNFKGGGSQGGSSGSGYFDVDGLLIGDLSGGRKNGGSCGPLFGKNGLYSKLSYTWENEYDQTAYPQYAGAPSQLKTWLDPINSGALTLGYAKPNCSNLPTTSINDLKNRLEESINLYPNPSQTGIVNARFNLTTPEAIQINVFNSMGRLVKSFSLSSIITGSYSFDCSELSDGIYLMNFSTKDASVGKKFIIKK